MTANEVLFEITRARPGPDDVVYIERRGDDYGWSIFAPGRALEPATDGPLPDAWIFRSGAWPLEEPEKLGEFFADLLAELDSMATGADRCRWDLSDPWPWHH